VEVSTLVDLVEQAADATVDRYSLSEPRMKVIEARQSLSGARLRRAAMAAITAASIELHASSVSVNSVFHAAANASSSPNAEYAAQARLLRCVFGNPFCPVAFSPSWRTDTAVILARQMYESRAFSAMPILADALQDAGCDSADVLDHCRGPGPHVRGCWVVDLLLGKE
jgi:hypothetical protein